MSKIYTVFEKSEDIAASSARVAITRYMKTHPGSDGKTIKAAPLSAIRTMQDAEVVENKEEGATITDTKKVA